MWFMNYQGTKQFFFLMLTSFPDYLDLSLNLGLFAAWLLHTNSYMQNVFDSMHDIVHISAECRAVHVTYIKYYSRLNGFSSSREFMRISYDIGKYYILKGYFCISRIFGHLTR
jgi:hypothetical protein